MPCLTVFANHRVVTIFRKLSSVKNKRMLRALLVYQRVKRMRRGTMKAKIRRTKKKKTAAVTKEEPKKGELIH